MKNLLIILAGPLLLFLVLCGALWLLGKLGGFSGDFDHVSTGGWIVLSIGGPILGFVLNKWEKLKTRKNDEA